MEKLIESFLDTKYREHLVIKSLYLPSKVSEICLHSGGHLISYGITRKGDMYSYIEWNVTTMTLQEILPYFDENIGSLEKIILKWVKDKFAEQGYNIYDPNIIKQLIKEV